MVVRVNVNGARLSMGTVRTKALVEPWDGAAGYLTDLYQQAAEFAPMTDKSAQMTNLSNFTNMLNGGNYRRCQDNPIRVVNPETTNVDDLLNLYPGKVVSSHPQQNALAANPYTRHLTEPKQPTARDLQERAVAVLERKLDKARTYKEWCEIETQITEAWNAFYAANAVRR